MGCVRIGFTTLAVGESVGSVGTLTLLRVILRPVVGEHRRCALLADELLLVLGGKLAIY